MKVNLHPKILRFLERASESQVPSLASLPLSEARDYGNSVLSGLASPTEELKVVANDMCISGPIGKIPIRAYQPEGKPPFPALVFFHGGGWVLGNLDTHHSICSSLAFFAKIIVVSVDYKLAPEHKFPAAIEDARTALDWVYDHADQLSIDRSRIAVGGDSAGANIATVLSIINRDEGLNPPAFQLLVYPVTNLSSFETQSYRKYAEKFIVKHSTMEWFRSHYISSKKELKNHLVSPLLTDNLRGLPPAFIITAEYDILKDDGCAYAEKLKSFGVPVKYKCYNRMIHLFWGINVLNNFENGIHETANTLREIFKN